MGTLSSFKQVLDLSKKSRLNWEMGRQCIVGPLSQDYGIIIRPKVNMYVHVRTSMYWLITKFSKNSSMCVIPVNYIPITFLHVLMSSLGVHVISYIISSNFFSVVMRQL